jgi:hypothetical protein
MNDECMTETVMKYKLKERFAETKNQLVGIQNQMLYAMFLILRMYEGEPVNRSQMDVKCKHVIFKPGKTFISRNTLHQH